MKKENIYALDGQKSTTIYDQTLEELDKNYDLRYDTIGHEFEIKLKLSEKWEQLNLNSLIINLTKSGVEIRIDKLLILLKSSMIEQFNPISGYFLNLPKWDEVDHISKLAGYVPTYETKQFVYHLKKWMVRAVKCALEEKYFNKQCFVLIHRGQSSGKTTWCRFLSPPDLSSYFSEDIGSDKDSRIQLTKNFLINLDELSVLAKKEINSLKSYFSKTSINERLPYDKKSTTLNRVASFIGSTNLSSFLTDETGSVRWLLFELSGKIDFNYSKEIDINKVWAQAYHLAYNDKGFNPEMTFKDIEENELRNKRYSKLTTEQELIAKYYEKTNNEDEFVTASDILIKLSCLNLRLSYVNIGEALSGFGYKRFKHSKRQVYGYLAKSKDNSLELE